jgi:hypothetical protein
MGDRVRKPTLDDMVALMRRDADRASNYLPDRVAAGKISQRAADFELETREAGIRTVNLVREFQNEFRDIVRCRFAERAAAKQERGAP